MNLCLRCLVVEPLSKAREGETGRAGRVPCFNEETVHTAQHDQNKIEDSDEPVENTCDTETHPITVSYVLYESSSAHWCTLSCLAQKISSHYQSIFATAMLANVFFSCLGFGNVILAGGIFFRCHTNKGHRVSLLCRFRVALSVAHTNVCVCFSHVQRLLRQWLGQVLVFFAHRPALFFKFPWGPSSSRIVR